MTITINGNNYDGEWSGNALTFATDASLSSIESAFVPGMNATIIISESGTEVARYYNKGISSMTVMGSDPRTVTVEFSLTKIEKGAETEIREDIEITDGAITELADMLADLLDMNADTRIANLESWKSDMTTEEGTLEEIRLRIARLEEKIGGVS